MLGGALGNWAWAEVVDVVDWWIGGRVANGAYENSNRAKHKKHLRA